MNTGSKAGINVTPLIDILLVLLIVFMAISPQKSTGLDALVPRSEEADSARAPENPIVLEIADDGGYRVNSEKVGAADLAARLRSIFGARAERVLFVRAAAELEFGVVAAAIDLTHGANVDRVALMTR